LSGLRYNYNIMQAFIVYPMTIIVWKHLLKLMHTFSMVYFV